jgi:hypothetical protein
MKTHAHCRLCPGQLDSILNLGELHLSAFLAREDPIPPKVPLELCVCRACDLVQLRHSVSPDELFRKYWYLSGINETMRAELQDVVQQAQQAVGGLSSQDTVIDIGANDGTLLRAYEGEGRPFRIAFEPAFNLYDQLRPHAEVFIADYFPNQLGAQQAQAKIITSIAMFYDLEDPRPFIRALADVLHPDGIWVCQFQDLQSVLEAHAYDDICHEHQIFYSLKTFERLLAPADLELIHAERRAINGGSLRLYVQHRGGAGWRDKPARGEGVEALREREADLDWDALQRFAWEVGQQRRTLKALLTHLHAQGTGIDLYGCSTKMNTVLQYCGITKDLIRWGVERSPEKYNRRTVGTNIPIVSEDHWRRSPHPTALVGIWQHRESVLQREATFLDSGGQFIFPFPFVEIVIRA